MSRNKSLIIFTLIITIFWSILICFLEWQLYATWSLSFPEFLIGHRNFFINLLAGLITSGFLVMGIAFFDYLKEKSNVLSVLPFRATELYFSISYISEINKNPNVNSDELIIYLKDLLRTTEGCKYAQIISVFSGKSNKIIAYWQTGLNSF